MKKFFASIAFVTAFLIVLNSCTTNNGGATPTQVGAFLVAQISPDAPRLNLNINGNSFDTGLVFGTYTPYVTANPGTYTFSTIASGSSTSSDTSTVNISANKYYSFFIIDSFSKLKTAFVNDVFKAPSSDSVYIRFFNFCPNIKEPINFIDTVGQQAFSQNRTFNDASLNPQNTIFNEYKAGIYTFIIKGTTSNQVYKTQTDTLIGGKVYTLFAKGINGNANTAKGLAIGQLENYPQR